MCSHCTSSRHYQDAIVVNVTLYMMHTAAQLNSTSDYTINRALRYYCSPLSLRVNIHFFFQPHCARCHWRCVLDVQFASAVDAVQSPDVVDELKRVSCGSKRSIVALSKPLTACRGPYYEQHCIPANAYTSTYTTLQQKQKQVRNVVRILFDCV
jgi:hypothetical protein